MSHSAEISNVGFFSPFYYQGLDDLEKEYDLDLGDQKAWKKSVAVSALLCVPGISQCGGGVFIAWGKDIFASNKPAGIGMILKGVLYITNIGSVALFFTDIAASALVAVVRKVRDVFNKIFASPRTAAEEARSSYLSENLGWEGSSEPLGSLAYNYSDQMGRGVPPQSGYPMYAAKR